MKPHGTRRLHCQPLRRNLRAPSRISFMGKDPAPTLSVARSSWANRNSPSFESQSLVDEGPRESSPQD